MKNHSLTFILFFYIIENIRAMVVILLKRLIYNFHVRHNNRINFKYKNSSENCLQIIIKFKVLK